MTLLKKKISLFVFVLCLVKVFSQKAVNTDSLYFQALELFKTEKYLPALEKTNQGLLIAPEYTDIRILRIRIAQNLKHFELVSKDISYLHQKDSIGTYLPLVEKQLRGFEKSGTASVFIAKISPFYVTNINFQLTLAETYMRLKQSKQAKKILKNTKRHKLNSKQKYRSKALSKKLSKNTLGLNHEILTFLADFPIRKTWHSTQLTYAHFLKKFSLMGSILNSHRFSDQGRLYELTSYTTISPNLYGHLNLGYSSKNNFYQNYGADISLYQTLFKSIELEIGGKYLDFGEQSFLSGIMGITVYTGDFYINIRGGMGPKIQDELVQNYQTTVRYYLQSDENHLYARIGTGISSDEATQFTQIVSNPNLKTYYGLAGISKWYGTLNMGLSAGYQYQELGKNRIGYQILGSATLKYRL